MAASFDTYMLSSPRNMLSQATNNGTNTNPPHPLANDAGNWTACQVYSGMLVGTFRDVSACMLSSKLGRPATAQELRALSFNDVKNLFLPIWNRLGANQLTDQDVANIYMHISLHYGNIRVAQRALNKLGENLTIDGVAGPATIAAMVRQTNRNATRAYNTIREELRLSYAADSNNATAFLSALNRYFPTKSSSSTAMGVGGALVLIGIGAAAYFYTKNKNSA